LPSIFHALKIFIDMINFGIGNLRTGILNLADLAVTFGGGLMIYYLLFSNDINHSSSPTLFVKKTDSLSSDENQNIE